MMQPGLSRSRRSSDSSTSTGSRTKTKNGRYGLQSLPPLLYWSIVRSRGKAAESDCKYDPKGLVKHQNKEKNYRKLLNNIERAALKRRGQLLFIYLSCDTAEEKALKSTQSTKEGNMYKENYEYCMNVTKRQHEKKFIKMIFFACIMCFVMAKFNTEKFALLQVI